jgi:hypothetical protein
MSMVRRSAAEWAAIVREWDRTGEDATTFAAKRGLVVATLRWWRTELKARDRGGAVRFVDVIAEEEPPSQPLVVVVAAGHRVVVPRGFDAAEVRRLVDALC